MRRCPRSRGSSRRPRRRRPAPRRRRAARAVSGRSRSDSTSHTCDEAHTRVDASAAKFADHAGSGAVRATETSLSAVMTQIVVAATSGGSKGCTTTTIPEPVARDAPAAHREQAQEAAQRDEPECRPPELSRFDASRPRNRVTQTQDHGEHELAEPSPDPRPLGPRLIAIGIAQEQPEDPAQHDERAERYPDADVDAPRPVERVVDRPVAGRSPRTNPKPMMVRARADCAATSSALPSGIRIDRAITAPTTRRPRRTPTWRNPTSTISSSPRS